MTIIVKTNLIEALNKKMASLIHKDVYVGIPGDKVGRKPVGHELQDVYKKNGQLSKRKKKVAVESKINNAQLGYLHEKGSPANNIPARPFLIPGVEDAGKKVSNILGSSAVNIENTESVDIALNKAGLVASQSVKRRITQSIGIEGLKESTVKTRERRKSRRRSGAMKPLIDTGQMLNSITYVVRDR